MVGEGGRGFHLAKGCMPPTENTREHPVGMVSKASRASLLLSLPKGRDHRPAF